jgi:hypothetical protein
MSQRRENASGSIAWSSLVLLRYSPISGSAHTLQWIVTGSISGKYSSSFTVFVYPLSGVVHLLPRPAVVDDIYVHPSEVRQIHVASVLALALAASTLFFAGVRRRVLFLRDNESLTVDEKTQNECVHPKNN